MKIKQKENKSYLREHTRDLFRKRKAFVKGMLLIGGLFLVIILFFGILGYGAYLKKTGETKYYKHALLRIADLDFSFLSNYAKGKFSNFDKIEIDIKFKHLSRLQYLREKALQEGIISEEIKEEEFPATLTYNGIKKNVKISLTGMMLIHVTDPSKWSFEVKLKGGDTVNGMKRFGLLLPYTRGYLTDWLAMELMKDRGLMGLRVDFARVAINGKSMGIFYLEERFDKYLVENNRLREGIIFKLEKEVQPYQEGKLMADSDKKAQLLLLRRMWQDVMSGKLEAGKFFDLEKMATLFAITDLMNNRHALYRDNLRFYFNPVTCRAEPIAREWGFLTFHTPENPVLFLQEPKIATLHYDIKRDTVLNKIYNNLEFKTFYLKELERLSDPEVLDRLLKQNGEKLNALLTKVYNNWPFYELPTHILYESQQYIHSTLYSDISLLSAYVNKIEPDRLNIYLKNHQVLPLEIFYLSLRDSIKLYPENTVIIDRSLNSQPQLLDFKIPLNQKWDDSLISEIKIHYNILGMVSDEKSAIVFPWPYEERLEHTGNPVANNANYNTFNFIIENDKDEIIIPAGNWTLNRNLIIPAEKNLIIEPGAKIDFIQGARIVTYSPLYSLGTKEQPIFLHSSDTTGQGILVLRAEKTSRLTFTTFDYLSSPQEEGWHLTSAVTFYESPVDLSNCMFFHNQKGDDYLNIIRSDFTLNQCQFKDVLADALDCDFTKGTISNSSFINVGNDGIDVSGTDIEISHVFMKEIGDKGLSAGENSRLSARWVEMRDAEIGITSKDQSNVKVSDATLLNCRIGITLFQKKSEFGPGQASADRVKITESEIPYLIEKNSKLILDGKEYLLVRDNVKDLLYGVQYGKSSR